MAVPQSFSELTECTLQARPMNLNLTNFRGGGALKFSDGLEALFWIEYIFPRRNFFNALNIFQVFSIQKPSP